MIAGHAWRERQYGAAHRARAVKIARVDRTSGTTIPLRVQHIEIAGPIKIEGPHVLPLR